MGDEEKMEESPPFDQRAPLARYLPISSSKVPSTVCPEGLDFALSTYL